MRRSHYLSQVNKGQLESVSLETRDRLRARKHCKTNTKHHTFTKRSISMEDNILLLLLLTYFPCSAEGFIWNLIPIQKLFELDCNIHFRNITGTLIHLELVTISANLLFRTRKIEKWSKFLLKINCSLYILFNIYKANEGKSTTIYMILLLLLQHIRVQRCNNFKVPTHRTLKQTRLSFLGIIIPLLNSSWPSTLTHEHTCTRIPVSPACRELQGGSPRRRSQTCTNHMPAIETYLSAWDAVQWKIGFS